ncbi:MAG TPA: hypothetical protein VEQ63_15150 [Bryobacteraceae bacterium]|nr:hypothetical protein [Bryobacteraceae bacterium]
MRVRIRLNYAHARRRSSIATKQTALVISSLTTPVALMAWALGAWRVLADTGLTGRFVITRGLLSHWQVWIAMGIAFQFAGFVLHRYALSDSEQPSDKRSI